MVRNVRGVYGGLRRDTNLDAKSVHHNTYGSRGLGKGYRPDEILEAQLNEQTRRMFNEWEIESRADRRHANADGSKDVGYDIKINKRRPYSDYYKYGLIK